MEENQTKRLEELTVVTGLGENTSQLFKFFCNALYLGQWELARACVQILQLTNQKSADVVQDIALQAFHRCVYSQSVPSACHLAWLSHLETRHNETRQTETRHTTARDTQQDLAEFHLLLLEVCPYIADIHLKELYSFYKWLHTPVTSTTPVTSMTQGHVLTLSPGLLKFLQTLLTTHTRLAHNLITHITHNISHGDSIEPLTKNQRAIQFVYVNAVNGLLDSLTQSDLDEDLKHSHVGKIYDILSLFDLPRDITPQLLKPVLSKLIEVANLRPTLLKKQAVMSVLVGQGDTCMLDEFCRLDYEAETNKAVETYQICAELSEEQRWLLHLLSLTDDNSRWKMMLMFAVKTKKHILEVIMETGLALIKCSMFTKLSALLEPPELHPLKPLLLLLGWTSCINSSEGRELLHTLWNKKSVSEHPAITMGCKKLAYQIDLIQWCVEKARPLMKEDVSGPRLSRSVDLFRGLESHSVLYVLNTSTRLSALDQGEVLQLLQKVPLTVQPEDKDKKRVKSVRFQDFDHQDDPDSREPDADSPSLSLDQLKDMSIYTGYCALKNVMDAIWYCAQSADRRLSRPVLLQGKHAVSRRLMSGSSSESERSRSNSETSVADDTNLGSNENIIDESSGVDFNIHNLYAENVTSKLNDAKNYLAKLQPLTFRVEMLEDVFSLLFVTHDDIQDILQASEYNSDEGDDSKSASVDVPTPVLTPIKELPLRARTGAAKLRDTTNVTAAYDEPYIDTPTESHVDQNSVAADEKIDMNKVGKALENMKSHISKRRHKSSDDNWLDKRSSMSENISSLSASSSVNMDLIGFICSEYLVRDILAMLKDCILDVSAAKFQIHGNKTDSRDRYKPARETVQKATVDLDPNIEESLCHLVKASITMETLQKRITQLERFTSEAHWRYQLVSDEHIPRAPGQVLSEVVMTTGGLSDDEVEIKDSARRGSRRRKSSSSKSGKDGQESNAGRKWSQVRRFVSRVSVAKIPGQSRSRQLVSTMLASPATLLTMSIRRDQNTQTKQIIKLFKLDATPEAVEVYFSQALEKAVHAVQRSPGKDTQGSGVKAGLRGVAAAAAAGLANVTISDVADELLKSPHLPDISVPLNVESLPSNIAQVLRKDNVPLIILLDLMMIAANSWEVCSHLMSSITSKLAGLTFPVDSSIEAQDPRNASTKQRVSRIRTFPDIVSQLQKLLNLGIEEDIPSREHILLSRTFQRSLQHYLSHATLSLSAEKNKEYVIICQNLAKCISRTNEAFTLSKSKSPGSPESTAQSIVVDERERSRSRMSSGSRSGSNAARPVIHHCFKQLIHLMEKDVPANGLLAFVNKSLFSNQTARRNYLLNVYKHCKELAFLVEEAESKDKDGVVAPKNYFHVLEEGPLRILGRMMFTKKMAPAKLEKVAGKLSLNLTHIIVYSCCDRVPSKRLPALTAAPGQAVERIQGQSVHNSGQYAGSTSYTGPEDCVRLILNRLIAVMRDVSHGCNARGMFDRTCAQQIWTRADFHDVITQARLLQSADLSDLDPAHRKCFYGNLLSLMTVHCFLYHQQTIDSQNEQESVMDGGEVGVPYTNMTTVDQLMVLSDFSYRVGQLGVVSVFDLRYQICRTGLPAPSEWGPVLKHRLSDLDPCDPWVTLAPTPDPLLLFSSTSCYVSSPPLQVLEPSRVEEQLRSNIAGYLEATVNINLDQNQVRVPELLLWYRRDFLTTTDQSEGGDSMGDLLAFVSTQLSGDKGTQLLTLLKTDKQKQQQDKDGKSRVTIDIEVLPFCKEYLVSFDFKSLAENEPSENEASKPSMQPLDRHSSDVATTYSLTPNTMEYIKSDCPLIATLVSLMCQDNFDEALMDNVFGNQFENSGSPGTTSPSKYQLNLQRSRAASSMSTLDIRSYRYEKLENDYPALKRRLLNYIVPLAATEDPEILKGGDPILKLLTSDILERFKTNMLSLHESQNFRRLLSDLLNELLSVRKWPQMLKIIDSIPVNIVHKHASMLNLHDFIVCCAVHKVVSEATRDTLLTAESSSMVVCLLSRMISPERRIRQVLAVHRQLRIEHCLDVFEVCAHSKGVSSGLMDSLQTRYCQLKIYHRITECAKNLQIKLSMQGADFMSADDKLANQKRHNILQQFTDWSNVVTWTRNTPREVLGLLTKAGDFKTAKTWAQLEHLPDDIKMDIEVNHIVALLNLSPPNTAQAFMILEGLRSSRVDVCLQTCRKFLDTFSNQQHIMFVASYMLKQLETSLSGAELTRVRLVHIGARMVQCLPVQMHSEYGHLVSKPRFILEQLLMNMRPELAGKAFSVVREEFTLVPDPAFKFSPEQFNMLVSLYAKKALEFTVVQVIDETVKERSLSVRSISSQDLERLSPLPLPRNSLAPPRLDPSMKRRSVDLTGSLRLGPASKRTDSPSSRAAVLGGGESFVMPPEPPARDQWVPDSAVSVCMVCHVERFSMFSRRHHCRRCGRVVCSACSANVSMIKGISARTCDDCYGEINKSNQSQTLGDRRQSAAEIYSRQRISDASPGGSPVSTAFSHASMSSMAIHEQATNHSLADIVNHSHSAWKLQTDDEYNANMREDFYFEQAPSTSLCISILNLHSSGRECGRLILGLCDTLSCLLKPLAPGVPNPEVDYNLIMSMMKYLLFHAKMKFTRHGDNAGMGRCDVYQGLVDLLGLLVVDNYPDLPSIEELTKVESVRRLRDKLIADERLSLAMEVSTKCGLDPAGVWVAWGMMALQSGDFPTSRDKFSRCLKPVKDRNVCTPIPSVVKDIVECLESMPGTGSMEIQVLLANPGSIKSLISTPSSTFFEETSMDSTQFQESVFYLRTYGTYLALVDFHRRHGYFMKAVQYILDHKCSVEVYIEGLLRPSIECGELGRLKDQMLLVDPSLERWNPFLTAACRHLVKNKLHHLLHDFQIFMKDFIRAGITCFTYFYQEGAQSYLDLARRITFLFTAQQHMQAYLEPAHWGNVQHPLSVKQRQEEVRDESTAVRLVKGPEEVSRYMKTIALQIEITKYLQASFSGPTGEALATRAAGLSKLPTLFAGQPVRNDLVIMVLLCGDNLETSFTLALRIIKEYKLGAVGIFTHVAREMAKLRFYNNLRELLGLVEKTEYSSDDVMDEILGACLIVVADIPEEAKEAENIIKMLRKDANKINAYILCGKLKSAYLLAVKDGRTEEVRRILRAAKSMNQPQVVNICNKWLEQNSS